MVPLRSTLSALRGGLQRALLGGTGRKGDGIWGAFSMSKPPVRSAHECEIDMEYPLASHKTLPSRDVEPAQHPALDDAPFAQKRPDLVLECNMIELAPYAKPSRVPTAAPFASTTWDVAVDAHVNWPPRRPNGADGPPSTEPADPPGRRTRNPRRPGSGNAGVAVGCARQGRRDVVLSVNKSSG
ncbi:hypothetical protein ACCO45_004581 [Purpureocillium lilacinum]|uniref:Uncharacterized protein n=1 Tax=Purpureocillium lilacinum TaxID=33203 RepID=A0ACC4DT09_PURLI